LKMDKNIKNAEHTTTHTPPKVHETNSNDVGNINYNNSYYNGVLPMGINSKNNFGECFPNNPNLTNNNNMYGALDKYLINYNYVDPSYYSINPNAIINMGNPIYSMGNQGNNSYSNSVDMYQNKISEQYKYNYNNLDPNINNSLHYNIQGNKFLTNFNQPVSSTFNNNNNIEDKKNVLEMTNTSTYNVNNLLRNNILSSEYFRSLITLKTFKEVLDEILSYADHAEPYCIGSTRAPSTLFCCLYKLFTMHLSKKQVI
ncbi:hypothetical protein, partial [Plasmodium yoelii yoelii]